MGPGCGDHVTAFEPFPEGAKFPFGGAKAEGQHCTRPSRKWVSVSPRRGLGAPSSQGRVSRRLRRPQAALGVTLELSGRRFHSCLYFHDKRYISSKLPVKPP